MEKSLQSFNAEGGGVEGGGAGGPFMPSITILIALMPFWRGGGWGEKTPVSRAQKINKDI